MVLKAMGLSEHLTLSRWVREVAKNTDASATAMKVKIKEWQLEDHEFNGKLDRLLISKNRGWYDDNNPTNRPAVFELPEGMEDGDWRQILFEHASRLGSLQAACEYLALPYGRICKMVDPAHKTYDAHFAELNAEFAKSYAGRLETVFSKGLEMAIEAGDHRTMIQGSLKALEMLDKAKWGKSLRVTGTIEHVHEMTVKKSRANLKAIEDRVLGGDYTLPPPLPELPEAKVGIPNYNRKKNLEVIDATYTVKKGSDKKARESW